MSVDQEVSMTDETEIDLSAEIETRKHIARVTELLHMVVKQLLDRADKHDKSKTESPEVETFAVYTKKLAGCTYGSEEYKQFLSEMQEGCLSHHYAKNRHHPEHFPNGVKDMTLIDLIEMLMDWVAASERHNDGNIFKSIEHNKERFKISGQLAQILVNTVEAFGFVEG